jgi:hypothetical protein
VHNENPVSDFLHHHLNYVYFCPIQVPFYDNASAFTRSGSCPVDDIVLDFQCPYTTNTHTCNQAKFGAHASYHVDFVCPFVVPLCLRYDYYDQAQFADHVCSAQSGYTPTEVRLGVGACTTMLSKTYCLLSGIESTFLVCFCILWSCFKST